MISRTSAQVHLHMSIEWALGKVPNNGKLSWADNASGRTMTNRELRSWLLQAKEDGKRVFPMGDCDNFDDQEGCRGHDVVLLVHDWEFEEGNG